MPGRRPEHKAVIKYKKYETAQNPAIGKKVRLCLKPALLNSCISTFKNSVKASFHLMSQFLLCMDSLSLLRAITSSRWWLVRRYQVTRRPLQCSREKKHSGEQVLVALSKSLVYDCAWSVVVCHICRLSGCDQGLQLSYMSNASTVTQGAHPINNVSL